MGRSKRRKGEKGIPAQPEDVEDLWQVVLGSLPAELRRWRACAESVYEVLSARMEALEPPAEELVRYFAPVLAQGPPDEEWMSFAAIHLMLHWRRGGTTVAEEALAGELGKDERTLLTALVRTPASLYEVIDADVKKGLLLRDRFRADRTAFVDGADQGLSYEVGELLPARVVAVGPYHLLELVGIPVPADHAAQALAWLEEEFRGFAQRSGTLDRDAFLAQHPERPPQASMAVLDGVASHGADGEQWWVEPDPSAAPRRRGKPSNKLYELEITLLDCPVDVQRVVRVAGDRSLGELHLVIQAAMGWKNCHLHRFEGDTQGGWRCADPRHGVEDTADEEETTIAEAAPRKGSRFRYEYDFGDGWIHEIRVLDRLELGDETEEPVCVGGSGACPPEDSGGVYGYAWKLEVLADPEHEEYEETRAWMGADHDPARFDAAAANRRLRDLTA